MGDLGALGGGAILQNGSKLEIRSDRFLIHTLQLKLWPFEVSPCLYREAMHLQCFCPRAHRLDYLYPMWPKLEYRQPACIV